LERGGKIERTEEKRRRTWEQPRRNKAMTSSISSMA